MKTRRGEYGPVVAKLHNAGFMDVRGRHNGSVLEIVVNGMVELALISGYDLVLTNDNGNTLLGNAIAKAAGARRNGDN